MLDIQVIWCGRALSGESTSTSTLSRESFQHSPAKLGERHVASTTSRIFTTHAREPPCRRNSDLFRHVFTTTACQGVSAAAVAATTNSDSVKADAGSSSSGGEAGATSKFLAPWPWVDPSRPQVLPISVVKKPRELIPLPEALGHLLVRLPSLPPFRCYFLYLLCSPNILHAKIGTRSWRAWHWGPSNRLPPVEKI